MNSEFYKKVLHNHGLSKYTSWQIGGPAEYFYKPKNLSDLVEIFNNCCSLPITLIGAGTNLLIRDGGVDGLVICLNNDFQCLERIDKRIIKIDAGAKIAKLVRASIDFGFIDCAFLAGIPGTIGGALVMNAGTHGDCIWNHVVSVETINSSGIIKNRLLNEFNAKYRCIDGLKENEWFIGACLEFCVGDVKDIKHQIALNLKKRTQSQPLNMPSCGSVFCNPKNDYAARLIESCQLKGLTIGKAQVSNKHANFIVNCGGASSVDVEALIKKIIITVKDIHGIELIPEVKIIGK